MLLWSFFMDPFFGWKEGGGLFKCCFNNLTFLLNLHSRYFFSATLPKREPEERTSFSRNTETKSDWLIFTLPPEKSRKSKNGCISNSRYLLNTAIFNFHRYGQSKDLVIMVDPEVRGPSTLKGLDSMTAWEPLRTHGFFSALPKIMGYNL